MTASQLYASCQNSEITITCTYCRRNHQSSKSHLYYIWVTNDISLPWLMIPASCPTFPIKFVKIKIAYWRYCLISVGLFYHSLNLNMRCFVAAAPWSEVDLVWLLAFLIPFCHIACSYSILNYHFEDMSWRKFSTFCYLVL